MGYLENYRIFVPESRRSLHIAKYRNEQKRSEERRVGKECSNCDITSHKARLIHREDGNYFMAIATVSTQGQNTPILQKYMKADVRIIVSNKTLWQQVFG